MPETATYAQIVQRWQQQPDEVLLIEGEWVAGRIAQAAESEARVTMEAAYAQNEEPAL